MKCSACSNDIIENYCTNCGQYYKNSRVTKATVFGDLFYNTFSLEKSFFKNIIIGLNQPKTLVSNYWNGFRRFYFSPGNFFVIASLFLLLNYLIFKNFLGITITSNVSSQFVFLIFIIFLSTILSYLLYFKFKKNIYEHLIFNIYNVSLWTIIFVPISIILNLLIKNNSVIALFFIPYTLLILIWNSTAFELTRLKRSVFVIINFILVYGIIIYLAYISGGLTK
ncbi:hypothetical protein WPG_2795 [Winogradskyella sp. PG-2]|nr:hypothetical protein WPG_2795 [Winogradskyella sp. PG-2]